MVKRRLGLALVSFAALVAVAACTPRNTAPQVNITAPADGSQIVANGQVVLSATADDAEDGDVSDTLAWTSNLDGALTPAAGGEVVLSGGAHTLTATATDSLGLTGTDGVTVNVAFATHLVSEGTTLHLLAVDGDDLVEVDSAILPAAGLLEEHQIFNVVAHPTQDWLFVSSMNSCGIDDDACWGNGRIDRFVVDGNSISYDGAAFIYDDTTTVLCALEPVDPIVRPGQVGWCALNGMVFSSDGSRLYVDDDQEDDLQIFSVDANGDLTFIAEGAITDVHGLAIDPTDTYLYNGSKVIEVTGDVPTVVFPGTGGNATTLVDLDGTDALITTIASDALAIFDISDPVLPDLIDEENLGTSQVRDLAFTADLGRIVAPGKNTVNALSFDGAVFTLDDTYTATRVLPTEYRAVQFNADATRAVVAWFTLDGLVTYGGVDLFSVAADGTLALLDTIDYPHEGRVVYTLP